MKNDMHTYAMIGYVTCRKNVDIKICEFIPNIDENLQHKCVKEKSETFELSMMIK